MFADPGPIYHPLDRKIRRALKLPKGCECTWEDDTTVTIVDSDNVTICQAKLFDGKWLRC